jgi:hypothetical protein
MKGVRKVCDALIVVQYEELNYAIALDMKSTNEGKAEQQIASSRLLMAWLIGLLDLHGHWRGSWKFCGVISFTPRILKKRGNIARKAPIPDPDLSQHSYPVFRLHNHPRLNLLELVAAADKAT